MLGTSVGSATSTSDGTYTIFGAGLTGALRIEFTNFQVGDYQPLQEERAFSLSQ